MISPPTANSSTKNPHIVATFSTSPPHTTPIRRRKFFKTTYDPKPPLKTTNSLVLNDWATENSAYYNDVLIEPHLYNLKNHLIVQRLSTISKQNKTNVVIKSDSI